MLRLEPWGRRGKGAGKWHREQKVNKASCRRKASQTETHKDKGHDAFTPPTSGCQWSLSPGWGVLCTVGY